jgi:hypothetical protein
MGTNRANSALGSILFFPRAGGRFSEVAFWRYTARL